jgi:hypothetical protein
MADSLHILQYRISSSNKLPMQWNVPLALNLDGPLHVHYELSPLRHQKGRDRLRMEFLFSNDWKNYHAHAAHPRNRRILPLL